MRFYGLLKDEDFLNIIQKVSGESWIIEDTKSKTKEEFSKDQIKHRLLEIANEINSWKQILTLMPSNTIFVFVADKEEPKAFKIYDTSSLGCSTTLPPPRWKVYQKGIVLE
ncbi:MAG: hypothetical protein ACP5UF_01835 [Hydrogenobaculum sp.]